MSKLARMGLIIVLGFLSGVSSTAQVNDQQRSLSELEKNMESNLTWNLESALLTYYPETKFVVKANVQLQKVKQMKALPQLPDALLRRDITSLPGLPFVPGQNANPAEQGNDLSQMVESTGVDVRRMDIDVLVDNSFTESDWLFIRRLVSLTADLDPRRGDRVTVEAFDFPVKANYFDPMGRRAQEAEPVAQQGLGDSLYPGAQKSGFDWRPFIYAGILAGIFLLILFWGMHSIARKITPHQQETALAVPPVAEKPESAKTPVAKESENEVAQQFEQKASVLDAIVGTPAAASRIFKRWINEDDRAGVRDTAVALKATSPHLNDFLTVHLGNKTSADIQENIDLLEENDVQKESPRVFDRFEKDLRELSLTSRRLDEGEDALAFLHQMSDDQLLHLIKPLKDGVRAIVLAQLPAERSFRIIRSLEPEKQKTALASMGNVEKVPSDVYQHIARQLLGRAKEVEKMKFVRANGIDALVEILDYMDEFEQDDLLEYIGTQDIKLAQRVRDRFMTFNQLVDLPPERLREVAFSVDRELFAKSLVHVDESTVNKIIESLPDKLAELVQASLEANQNSSEEEITSARRQLMRSVRHSSLHKEQMA